MRSSSRCSERTRRGASGPSRLRFWLIAIGGALVTDLAAAPLAVVQSAPGHFEVAAVEAAAANAVATEAEDAWRWLSGPLGLPEQFSTPVFVRLVPAADWQEAAAFRVIVEPGGVVSARVRWATPAPDYFLKRALVQALLMRLAVSHHGVTAKLAAPLWLEVGCVGWWETHAGPAQLDALKQQSGRFAPPSLAELLAWQRGEGEAPGRTIGAMWLLTWLQMESRHTGEWPVLLRRLLGGEEGLAALTSSFPGRFGNEAEGELWWQTGWHHLGRVRTLPTLEAAESRGELVELSRFVFSLDGREAVVPLTSILAHAREPAVAGELQRRSSALARLLPALHPFYRNAGLSLAEVLAVRGGEGPSLADVFEHDWADARELEAASHAALDALEKR